METTTLTLPTVRKSQGEIIIAKEPGKASKRTATTTVRVLVH
jgi:hypothetical protein